MEPAWPFSESKTNVMVVGWILTRNVRPAVSARLKIVNCSQRHLQNFVTSAKYFPVRKLNISTRDTGQNTERV